MIRIGEVILQKRMKRNLTQQQLADFLNVTKATISKWEKGNSYPDITLLPLLAAYFDITVDELLNAKRMLSKNDIRKHYVQFAERFSNESYDDVSADLQRIIKLYYDDENFLLQMAILLLNHAELAHEKAKAFLCIESLLKRVEEMTTDVWVKRQTNVLLATVSLYNGNAEDVLQRLEGSVEPILGEEVLLAQAYELLGEVKEAEKVIQVMMYQQILSLVSASTSYLKLISKNHELLNEAIRRVEGLIQLYHLETLHPNVSLQFYYTVALLYADKGKEEQVQKYLTSYVQIITTKFFPVQLKGDDFFTLLDDWFESSLDLGTNPLREEEMIRKSIHVTMQHPLLQKYHEDIWFLQLQQKLQSIGGKIDD